MFVVLALMLLEFKMSNNLLKIRRKSIVADEFSKFSTLFFNKYSSESATEQLKTASLTFTF